MTTPKQSLVWLLSPLSLLCSPCFTSDDPAAWLQTLVCGTPPLPLPGSVPTAPESLAGGRGSRCSQVTQKIGSSPVATLFFTLNMASFRFVMFHREVLRCTMITHQVLLRGAAQCFLLNSALHLTDVVCRIAMSHLVTVMSVSFYKKYSLILLTPEKCQGIDFKKERYALSIKMSG